MLTLCSFEHLAKMSTLFERNRCETFFFGCEGSGRVGEPLSALLFTSPTEVDETLNYSKSGCTGTCTGTCAASLDGWFGLLWKSRMPWRVAWGKLSSQVQSSAPTAWSNLCLLKPITGMVNIYRLHSIPSQSLGNSHSSEQQSSRALHSKLCSSQCLKLQINYQ